MSTYRLNVVITLVLAVLLISLHWGGAQPDIFHYGQKRSTSTRNKYCGKVLSNALQLLCNGVYNAMPRPKNAEVMELDDYPYAYEDSYPFRSRISANAMMGRFGGMMRFRRGAMGVHDECCVKPCTLDELSSYCGR